MSGGSYDYFYERLHSIIGQIEGSLIPGDPGYAERRAFAAHLVKVQEALHDIEWVDSGDYAKGGEVASILACIGASRVLKEQVALATRVLDDLERFIKAIIPEGGNE